MAANDCPGRDALRRLVELREDRELFLDEESCGVIRGYILRDLVALPHTSRPAKIGFAVFAVASLAATAYGLKTPALIILNVGAVGLPFSVGTYLGHKRELAACRQFTREERLDVIDEIETAAFISAGEAAGLRANVEKLARETPELAEESWIAVPWNRAAAALEAARGEASLAQIAASRASRWSDVLERFDEWRASRDLRLIASALGSSAVAYLTGQTLLAKALFCVPFVYLGLFIFGAAGVWMTLQAYLIFRIRLADGERASAWIGLALRSLPCAFVLSLGAVACWVFVAAFVR